MSTSATCQRRKHGSVAIPWRSFPAASPSVFAVFDKDGAQIAGPTGLDTLWASGGAAGACLRSGYDPIVLYDRLADRWLMSQFVDDDAGGHHLCVSVSQTPDPVSCGWYLYDFPTPEKPDYLKDAVWPEPYYVSTDESAPLGARPTPDAGGPAGDEPALRQRAAPGRLCVSGDAACRPRRPDAATGRRARCLPAPSGRRAAPVTTTPAPSNRARQRGRSPAQSRWTGRRSSARASVERCGPTSIRARLPRIASRAANGLPPNVPQ